MGLGKLTSVDDDDPWRVGHVPSRREAAAWVVAFIVVTSVIVVYTEVYHFGGTCGTEPETVIIVEPVATETRRVLNEIVYDAWFEVTDVFAARQVPWTSVTYWITDEDGLAIRGWFTPVPEEIGFRPNPVGYYREQVGKPEKLDVGDQLCLANLNRTYQGMTFTLMGTPRTSIGHYEIPDCDVTYSLDVAFLDVTIPRKGANLWDVTFSVISVGPEWEQVPWSFLTTRENLTRNYGHARYEHYPLYPVSRLPDGVNFPLVCYYNDSGSVDGYVDIGDRVTIRCDWSLYMGQGGVSLYTGNASIAQMDVPYLPDTKVVYDFSDPVLIRRDLSEGLTVWDCEFTIVGLEPEQGTLEWGHPRVRFDSNRSVHEIPWWLNAEKEEYPTSAQAFFREVEPLDGMVQVGDVIMVKRMSRDFEGATLVVAGPGTEIRLSMPWTFY